MDLILSTEKSWLILKDSLDFFVASLSTGTRYYRARKIEPGKGVWSPEEMGMPPWQNARPSRISPQGIPVLYLADTPITAVAEIRPHLGSRIALVPFRLRRDIHIIDYADPIKNFISEDGTTVLAPETSWRQVFNVFSTPFDPDDTLAYTFSQMLSEGLKFRGAQGLRYSSAMNPSGVNLALYSDDLAVPDGKVEEVEVKGLSYEIA